MVKEDKINSVFLISIRVVFNIEIDTNRSIIFPEPIKNNIGWINLTQILFYLFQQSNNKYVVYISQINFLPSSHTNVLRNKWLWYDSDYRKRIRLFNLDVNIIHMQSFEIVGYIPSQFGQPTHLKYCTFPLYVEYTYTNCLLKTFYQLLTTYLWHFDKKKS